MDLRFYLYLNDDDSVLTQVYPNYKDDLAKETELESNQRFYREKISGKMRLNNTNVVKDFDFVMSQPFDTQYNLVIEKSNDYGQTWEREYLGKFFQTDCKINYDDFFVEFQPDAVDEYTKVLAGIEKESNLANLAIDIQGIHLQKRPLIQIYIPGEEIVSCFLSGMAWEQDVRESTLSGNKLTQDYKFSVAATIRQANIQVSGTPTDASGLYVTKSGVGAFGGDIFGGVGYKLNVTNVLTSGNVYTRYKLIRVSGNVLMFEKLVLGVAVNHENVIMDPVNGTGNAVLNFKTISIYSRYLLDLPSINGVGTYPIPGDDLVDNNRNYRRVIGYAIDTTSPSSNLSDEPTEWGKNPDGKYYVEPYSIFGKKYYPIGRSKWNYGSLWFSFDDADSILEVKGRTPVLLKDSYPIQSVISALLKEYAPNITHEGTEEYSEFLYGDINPVYFGEVFRLFISQKTNLLNIQYQNPAQKTPMDLQKVLNMLRDCFRCFWYIEDNKLKIEHVSWFRNGGSYVDTPGISYDVTTMINPRNGKDWGFSTSEVTFDKMDMPERFEFKWMDDVSNIFEGMPIEVISRYVMPGKIEEINVSNFNSDIDYLLLNPSEISQDGFVLMAAVEWSAIKPLNYGDYTFIANNALSNTFDIKPEFQNQAVKLTFYAETISGSGATSIVFLNSANTILPSQYPFTADGDKEISFKVPDGAVKIGVLASSRNIQGYFKKMIGPGEYELPFVDIELNNVQSTIQNGIVSFTVLQPNFWTDDLPAKLVKINGEEMTVSVDRKRKQTLNFPIDDDFDPKKLVNTHIGLGQIDKISLNLHSRNAKTTLKYDTEQ